LFIYAGNLKVELLTFSPTEAGRINWQRLYGARRSAVKLLGDGLAVLMRGCAEEFPGKAVCGTDFSLWIWTLNHRLKSVPPQ